MKELALLYQLYLPLSSSFKIIIFQLRYLSWRWRIVNLISYLLMIFTFILLIVFKKFEKIEIDYCLMMGMLIFVASDYFCYKTAFKKYFKKFKTELTFFEIKPDFIRYLVFKDRLIDKGYYNSDFINRALQTLEVELLEFRWGSTIKNEIAMVILSCLVTGALEQFQTLKSPLVIIVLAYLLLKISISIYSSYSAKRKKQELNKFLKRIKIELQEIDEAKEIKKITTKDVYEKDNGIKSLSTIC